LKGQGGNAPPFSGVPWDRTGYGLVCNVMINSPELPINEEARNDAPSTGMQLY